jgi:sortase A
MNKQNKKLLSASVFFLVSLIILIFIVSNNFLNQKKVDYEPTTVIKSEQKNNGISYINGLFQLEINKIYVSAPIIFNVDGSNKKEYNNALEKGVAHLKGTALPGQNGTSFIFGHSSYYLYESGNYKKVFANLNKLKNGDVITIKGQQTKFDYKVVEKSIVKPNDLEVTKQNYQTKELILMTCWPVGTTEKRLIVLANLLEDN